MSIRRVNRNQGKAILGVSILRENKHQLLHRIASIWTSLIYNNKLLSRFRISHSNSYLKFSKVASSKFFWMIDLQNQKIALFSDRPYFLFISKMNWGSFINNVKKEEMEELKIYYTFVT